MEESRLKNKTKKGKSIKKRKRGREREGEGEDGIFYTCVAKVDRFDIFKNILSHRFNGEYNLRNILQTGPE